MASLRDTREALLLGYCEGWLDEMEFLTLNDLNTFENLDFPYDSYDQFNIDDIDEDECIAEFRFQKRHILQLEELSWTPRTVHIMRVHQYRAVQALSRF